MTSMRPAGLLMKVINEVIDKVLPNMVRRIKEKKKRNRTIKRDEDRLNLEISCMP